VTIFACLRPLGKSLHFFPRKVLTLKLRDWLLTPQTSPEHRIDSTRYSDFLDGLRRLDSLLLHTMEFNRSSRSPFIPLQFRFLTPADPDSTQISPGALPCPFPSLILCDTLLRSRKRVSSTVFTVGTLSSVCMPASSSWRFGTGVLATRFRGCPIYNFYPKVRACLLSLKLLSH